MSPHFLLQPRSHENLWGSNSAFCADDARCGADREVTLYVMRSGCLQHITRDWPSHILLISQLLGMWESSKNLWEDFGNVRVCTLSRFRVGLTQHYKA